MKGGKRVSNSGRPRIDVVETAQDGTGGDVSLAGPQGGEGRLKVQAAVWPVAVVVQSELREHGMEVLVVDHDHMVKNLRA